MSTCAVPPANEAPPPWYRQRWPWLLIAGPATVVLAALTTAWIAASGADPVLAEDYYKRGLLVNKRLAVEPRVVDPVAGAVLRFGDDGAVRVELAGVSEGAVLPATLRLSIALPTGHAGGRVIVLARDAQGGYAGRIDAPQSGRRIVTLEGEGWRLPTTVVDGSTSVVRLGTMDAGG